MKNLRLFGHQWGLSSNKHKGSMSPNHGLVHPSLGGHCPSKIFILSRSIVKKKMISARASNAPDIATVRFKFRARANQCRRGRRTPRCVTAFFLDKDSRHRRGKIQGGHYPLPEHAFGRSAGASKLIAAHSDATGLLRKSLKVARLPVELTCCLQKSLVPKPVWTTRLWCKIKLLPARMA